MYDEQEDLNQIELDIDHAREAIDRADALKRLFANKDFKRIIENGYFVDEASRLVLVKADPEMDSPEAQVNIQRSIDAIGPLRVYFRAILQFGDMAQRAIIDDEQTRENILTEVQ